APLPEPSLASLLVHLARPWQLGVLLVRRGGFAVAWVVGPEIAEAKTGQRHVQGRTKAGGWSQQRFARRRDNQARAAFDAAAGHVARILGPLAASLDLITTGGDRQAVDTVLAARELASLAELPRLWIGPVADPRRGVLEEAVQRARSLEITLTDPTA
ncbi:MAG: acVLRF1 family peptidyl-tRNA hydrolase, partial [Nocardioidaceae bacterium]